MYVRTRRSLAGALLAFTVFGGIAGCKKKQTELASAPGVPAQAQAPAAVAPGAPAPAADLSADPSGLSKATLVMKTSKGSIRFKLYPNDAPSTVKRFVELTQSKFYDGLAFHRVVPGFVVQTGDPKSRDRNDLAVGTGGSGRKLKAEFNSRKHVRGTVAMARASDPDSADSQFYFCLGAFPHLDGNYTVIGQVVDFGEKVNDKDVLDRIVQWDGIVEMRVE